MNDDLCMVCGGKVPMQSVLSEYFEFKDGSPDGLICYPCAKNFNMMKYFYNFEDITYKEFINLPVESAHLHLITGQLSPADYTRKIDELYESGSIPEFLHKWLTKGISGDELPWRNWRKRS